MTPPPAGTYDPTLQQLVPVVDTPGRYRVLTALRQEDGSVVPVVRGIVTVATLPPPPAGLVHETGVLLPSEDTVDRSPGADRSSTVRIPALAQVWPGPLVGGFVTLSAADAQAQQLAAAPLALPKASGRLRNGAYAVQWWVFAAFALAMAIRMARDFGHPEEREAEISAGSSPEPT